MNKRLLTFTIIGLFALFIFRNTSYSNSAFAPTGNTNAPNQPSCSKSGCHNSFPLQQNMMDRISITADGNEVDANFDYVANTTYNMQLSINNPSQKNGFSMTALDESGSFSGTLATTSIDAKVTSGFGGIDYIGHTNSAGVNSWDFTWTAPSDSQQITFYSVVNITNSNNNTSGDSIISRQVTFTTSMASDSTPTSIRTFDLNENILVWNSFNAMQLSLDVKSSKYFTFSLFSLNGTQVFSQKEMLHFGPQNLSYPLDVPSGLYILNVFSEGKHASYKVVF